MIPVQLTDKSHELLCTNEKGDLWYGLITKPDGKGGLSWQSPTPVKLASNWCKAGTIVARDINGDRLVDIVCKDKSGAFRILAGTGDYGFAPKD